MDIAALITSIVGLLGSIVVLYKAVRERRTIVSERKKVESEREQIEAGASEIITRTALMLIEPLKEEICALQERIETLAEDLRKERAKTDALQGRILELETELALAQAEIKELRARNALYLAIIRENGIELCEDPDGANEGQ